MKKLILFLALCFVIHATLLSQDDALQKSSELFMESSGVFLGVPEEVKTQAETFFDNLILRKVDKAFRDFLVDSPMGEKKEDIQNLVDQTKKSFDLYGRIMGIEPVSSEIVSPSFIKLRYLGLHTKFPMRWMITFYKSPEKGWIIINIKFDDQSEFYFTDS